MEIQFDKEQSFSLALNDVELNSPLHEDILYLIENLLPGDQTWIDGYWLKKWVVDSQDIMTIVPWSKYIPKEIYQNFILPFRVNNEVIDYERKELFAKLWPRIAGLNIEETVLSINIYCYENVRYTATDIRTLGPTALLKRGLGRCGEQSVLLVSLLRSVGIPARQCYVSRWSHTESNHAWVEVWAGNGWHYLGACEPEPMLDTGWFRENAARAILVQTRVGNRNYSLESVLARENTHSIVNITQNYAPTVCLQIQVCFQEKWIEGAQAQISVFNGGEFFPLHKFCTAEDGLSETFSIGLGDILLEVFWKGFCYWEIHHIQKNEQNYIRIDCELQKDLERERYFYFCPIEAVSLPELSNNLTSEKETQHKMQMKAGEIAYQAKIASFQTKIFAQKVLENSQLWGCFYQLDIEPSELYNYFHSAGCGAKKLYQAFEQLFPRFGMDLWLLLQSISEKERTFVSVFDLEDFLERAVIYKENYQNNIKIWQEYVLAPQVDFEPVCAHRRKIYNQLSCYSTELFNCQPSIKEILTWLEDHIIQENEHSFFYYRSSLPPIQSFSLKKLDKISYKILQIAVLRIFGYAARFNQSILAIEWLENGQWQNEFFSEQREKNYARLTLKNLEKFPQNTQISIGMRSAQKAIENLAYQTLYCGEVHAQESQHGETQSLANILSGPLPCGFYRLCLGLRDEKGNVRGWVNHFTLEEQQQKDIEIPVLALNSALQIYGNLNAKFLQNTETELQIYVAKDRINEPFYHLIHDMSHNEFCRQANVLFVEQDDDELDLYLRNFLDKKQIYFIAKNQATEIESAVSNWSIGSFPKILLLKGPNIVFFHCGYSRNIISQLANNIAQFLK